MTTKNIYKTFETELRVRPDDIDMYQHVHNSVYLDYVLAARYDQMERCYGLSMEAFMADGYGWVVKAVFMDFKRALTLGDYFIVGTAINTIDANVCRVDFVIRNKKSGKSCSEGWFDFVMIDIKTGKGVKIAEDVIKHYISFV